MYATAGTLAASADTSVLYVVVFKTPAYSETIAAENYRDYVQFMAKTWARSVKLPNKKALAHKLVLGGKELFCLYEYFELYS